MASSPNKRSFRGLGGVGRGLDSVTAPKSVRGKWPLWSPVVSRGLLGSPVVGYATIITTHHHPTTTNHHPPPTHTTHHPAPTTPHHPRPPTGKRLVLISFDILETLDTGGGRID